MEKQPSPRARPSKNSLALKLPPQLPPDSDNAQASVSSFPASSSGGDPSPRTVLPSPRLGAGAISTYSQSWPSLPFKTAFVTGGSGFIGRRLIRFLVSRKCKVKALARSSRAVKAVERLGAIAIAADLSEVDAMRDAMASGCDVVFHLAAKVDMWGEWEEYLKTNILGTRNVLLAAKAADAGRVVFLSTDAVLIGTGPLVDIDETRPLAPENIVGFYPKSKAVAEQVVVGSNGPKLRTVVVRAGRVWGADDTVFLKSVVDACKAGQFAWLGDGKAMMSVTHVENCCEALVCAAARGRPGQIYFACDREPLPFREFLEPLLQAKEVDITKIPLANKTIARTSAWLAETAWSILPLKGAPPAVPFVLDMLSEPVTINDTKARTELGYQALVTYEEGVRELIDEELARKLHREGGPASAAAQGSPRRLSFTRNSAGTATALPLSPRSLTNPVPLSPRTGTSVSTTAAAVSPRRHGSIRVSNPALDAPLRLPSHSTPELVGRPVTRSNRAPSITAAAPPPAPGLAPPVFPAGLAATATSSEAPRSLRTNPMFDQQSAYDDASAAASPSSSTRFGPADPQQDPQQDQQQSSTATSEEWRSESGQAPASSEGVQEEDLLLYMPKPSQHSTMAHLARYSVQGTK